MRPQMPDPRKIIAIDGFIVPVDAVGQNDRTGGGVTAPWVLQAGTDHRAFMAFEGPAKQAAAPEKPFQRTDMPFWRRLSSLCLPCAHRLIVLLGTVVGGLFC